MSTERKPHQPLPEQQDKNKNNNDTVLERLARAIDPPSREIPDEDILDPGRMTPKSPTDNRT